MVPLYPALHFQLTRRRHPRQTQWEGVLAATPAEVEPPVEVAPFLEPEVVITLTILEPTLSPPSVMRRNRRQLRSLNLHGSISYPSLPSNLPRSYQAWRAGESTDGSSSTSADVPASPAIDANTELSKYRQRYVRAAHDGESQYLVQPHFRTEQEDERDRWLIISSLFPSERRREKWPRVLGRKRKTRTTG